MMQFAHATEGRQGWAANARIDRHCHKAPYIAVVLDGEYLEAGDQGRLHLRPGGVVVHGHFESHANRFSKKGATILNLYPRDWDSAVTFGRIADADAVMRAAERDPVEAVLLLRTMLEPQDVEQSDWVDALAAALRRDPTTNLRNWARAHSLAPETISRGFRKVFGISPARFRSDLRARRAVKIIVKGRDPFSELACAAGYSDQAHMIRSIKKLTNRTPSVLRFGKYE